MKIDIIKDSRIVKSLAPGSYTLGRSNTCDIVLEGSLLSRKHAQLTITDKSWRIEDLGSINGVFVDGDKIDGNKKLSTKSTVTVGDYSFACNKPQQELSADHKKNRSINQFLSLAGGKPFCSALTVICLCCTIALIWISSISKSYLSSILYEYERDNAIAIVENTVHYNMNNWASLDLTRIDISFFQKIPGVEQLFLLNTHGRILAPDDQINHTLNLPLVAETLKKGTRSIVAQKSNKILICSPVRSQGEVIGLVVLKYQIQRSMSLIRDRIVSFTTGLLLVIALVTGGAFLLVKIFLRPWTDLDEAFEKAIVGGKTTIDYTAKYKEIENFTIQLDRLLLKKEREEKHPEPVQTLSRFIDSSPQPEPEKPKTIIPPTLQGVDNLSEENIVCIIDVESNQLIDCSSKFQDVFNLHDNKNLHILEVFQDPAIISEINVPIRDNEWSMKFELSENMYVFTKNEIENYPHHLLLQFESENV